jgi:hypothetical protein
MLAPVGVLPFLFGGVTATEVFTAFVLLFWFAVLSVAFGLSISSKFSTPAVAIVVTLLVAIPLSITVYVTLGPLLSMAVHELWPSVPDGPPVWLPTAYVRADFGLQYLALLVLCPVAAVALPAWLLYEVTLANMAGPSDDRSSGLRRWFAVSAPVVCVLCLLPGVIARVVEWQLVGTSCFIAFLLFAAFLFLGEPLGPSRRVRVHWQRSAASFRTRYFGPGILPASSLLFFAGLLGLALHMGVGAWLQIARAKSSAALDAQRVGAFVAYLGAFFVFVVGFCVWARARALASAVPRLLLLGVLFLASVGPWIAMAIAGIATQRNTSALIVAAPSPTYALVLVETLGSTAAERELVLGAGAICAAAWALLGFGLYGLGRARTKKTLASYDAAHEHLEGLLRTEDAGRSVAAAG